MTGLTKESGTSGKDRRDDEQDSYDYRERAATSREEKKDKDKDKDDVDKARSHTPNPGVRLVPLMRTPAPNTTPAPGLQGMKTPLLAPTIRGLSPANASRLTPLTPGLRPPFVRPVAHPLLRGLAKPRPTVPLLGASLGASLPSLRSPTPLHRHPLVAGLPKGGVNASTAALLAGMAGMDETANAELDGIREALLQAEATEQYLAARQEEIANALLAVAGASTSVPSVESLLTSNDQDAITKALLTAAASGGPMPPDLGLGADLGNLDDVTKALLGLPAPPGPGAAPAAPAGADGPGAQALGSGSSGGGLEALLAAAASGGGAAAEALLMAAAGGGGTTEALLAAAGASTGPAASSGVSGGSGGGGGPSGSDDGLDEMTKALLAAAGVDANAQGSDDVTQALLAAAVGNTAAVTAAADGKEDEITKALLAAASNKDGPSSEPPSRSEGSTAPPAKEAPQAPKRPEKRKEPEPPKRSASPSLPTPEAAASANVPEEMTKALLAAVATNTPSAAGDADRIIKAVLRAATASMSDANEPAPFPSAPEDKGSKAPEKTVEKPPPPPGAEEKKKEPPEKPAQKPHGSMVSTEFLRAMEENAKASARTSSAAKNQAAGARPPPISFAIGPASKKPKTDKLTPEQQEEHDALNQQLLEAETTKSWVFFGKIPKGTSEGLIRTECAKYGTVTSILYNAEPDSLFEEPWALVSLASLESAAKAVDRLNSRLTLFGGTQQVEVRMGTPEDLEKWEELVKAEEQVKVQPPPMTQAPSQETQLVIAEPLTLDRRQRRHEGGRRRARDPYSVDSRGSEGRGRRRRRGHESRSDSRSASDYRDPPPLPVTERKVYGLGGFDNASADADKKTPRATAAEASLVMAPSGDRRIGTRGSWAEFVTREWEYYYVNIHTGEKRWMLPVAEMRGVAPRRSN